MSQLPVGGPIPAPLGWMRPQTYSSCSNPDSIGCPSPASSVRPHTHSDFKSAVTPICELTKPEMKALIAVLDPGWAVRCARVESQAAAACVPGGCERGWSELEPTDRARPACCTRPRRRDQFPGDDGQNAVEGRQQAHGQEQIRAGAIGTCTWPQYAGAVAPSTRPATVSAAPPRCGPPFLRTSPQAIGDPSGPQ